MSVERVQAAGLSKQQERLWRWLQTGQIYSSQCMIMLEGQFDASLFQQALQQIVEQYEILRTTFSVPSGMDIPMQVVGHRVEISCYTINLQYLDATKAQVTLEEQWQELQQRSFDFEHGPLIDASIFCLAEQQHVFMLRMSALCADMDTLKLFI